MVIATGRQERGIAAKALSHLESEHVMVEAERTFQVGDFEMHVTDVDLRANHFYSASNTASATSRVLLLPPRSAVRAFPAASTLATARSISWPASGSSR